MCTHSENQLTRLTVLAFAAFSPLFGLANEPPPIARSSASQYQRVREMIEHAETLAEGIESASAHVHVLTDAELLIVGGGAAEADDRNVLFGVVGQELRQRCRTAPDITFALHAAADPREPESLRALLFSTLRSSSRFRAQAEMRSLADTGFDVLFDATDISAPLRIAALNGAAQALAGLRELQAISDEDVDIRCARLLPFVTDTQAGPELRRAAIKATSLLRYEEAVPHLLSIIDQPVYRDNRAIARSSVVALAELAATNAVESIGKLLQTTNDSYIHGSAAHALGLLGTDSSLLFLVHHAERFGNGSCATAIVRQRALVLEILRDPHSPYLATAVEATRFLYRGADVAIAKDLLTSLVVQVSDTELIAGILMRLHDIAAPKECALLLQRIPRRASYAEAWDAVHRKSIAVTIEPRTSMVPTDE